MHTLRPVSYSNLENGYEVIFDGGSKTYIIEHNLPKKEAMELVNFLNGGLGQPYGERPIIDLS